jgi:hypothetical protein
MQAGLGSETFTLIVPTGGFEVKTKQVLLQPASRASPNEAACQTLVLRA